MTMERGEAAGTAGGPENPNDDRGPEKVKDIDYYRNDAEKAREARNRVKEELRETRSELDQLRAKLEEDKQNKEAEGDLAKQLELAQAKLEELQGELQSERSGRRVEKIESAVLSKIPAEKHRLARTLLKSHASSLDDGKAQPEKVVEDSLEFLQDLAPDMFKDTGKGKSGGRPRKSPVLPIEGEDPSPALSKGLADLRKKHKGLLG